MDDLDILYVISNPSGWGTNLFGGGEIRGVEILKSWNSKGIRVETIETETSPSRILGAKYKVHTVSSPFKKGMFASVFILFLLILKSFKIGLLKRNQSNAVVACTSNLSDVAPAWILSKIAGKPFFVVFQLVTYESTIKGTYKVMRASQVGGIKPLVLSISANVMLKLSRDASGIICLTEHMRKIVNGLGFPEEKIFVNGMGIDVKTIDDVIAKNIDFEAVYLGRIVFDKGIVELLKSWKLVVLKKPNATLLIIGDGPFLQKAKMLVANLQIEKNVKFLGFIDNEKKYYYLKKSKIFVFPSRTEGFGLAILEALACGLPVIGFDNLKANFPDCDSLITAEFEDVEGLSRLIIELLEDDAKRKELSQISKEYGKRFNWESITRYELDIIKSVLERRP